MLDFIGKQIIEKKLNQCPLCKRHTVMFVGESTTPHRNEGRAYVQCLRCTLTLYSDVAELQDQMYRYGNIESKIVDDMIAKWNSIGVPEKSENRGE